VLARAINAVANRLGQTAFTDLTGDNGNPDPSLNPNGPAASRAGGYRSAGDAIEQMDRLNGFEIAKRILFAPDDGGLLAKLSRADRVSVSGGSASLLKRDDDLDMRKFEDGISDADCSAIIKESDELLKRLTARNAAGLRKSMDISVFNAAPRADEFRGSYSPGLDGLPLNAKIFNRPEDLVGKIAARHRHGGEAHLSKLLH
jgi:hypothetical protein